MYTPVYAWWIATLKKTLQLVPYGFPYIAFTFSRKQLPTVRTKRIIIFYSGGAVLLLMLESDPGDHFHRSLYLWTYTDKLAYMNLHQDHNPQFPHVLIVNQCTCTTNHSQRWVVFFLEITQALSCDMYLAPIHVYLLMALSWYTVTLSYHSTPFV